MSTAARVLIAVLSTTAVALAVTLTIVLTTNDSSDEAGRTFTLTGTLTITDPGGATLDLTDDGAWTCLGDGGYADIQPGAPVSVSDPAGTVLALGQLGQGGDTTEPCVMPITVPGVPTGHDIYQVEVVRRGTVPFSAQDATSGRVALTLG